MGQGNTYYKGLVDKRIHTSTNTMGGHSWVDYGSHLAIHELVTLNQKILAFKLPKDPRTSMNVGKIIGGTSINRIASEASFDLDLRSEKEPKLIQLVSDVKESVLNAEHYRVHFEIEQSEIALLGGYQRNIPRLI